MRKAVVISNIARLIIKPQYGEAVDEVLYGMPIDILEYLNNGWCKIRTHYNYEGYIDRKELLMDDDLTEIWMNKEKSVISAKFADVMDSPRFQGNLIRSLVKGCIVAGTGEYWNGFEKVYLPEGNCGFIRKIFLSEYISGYDYTSETDFRNSVVNTAVEYLGTQYRWGGKTPLGIDCSGLASMAYILNGALIYRDAKIKEGFPVKEIPFRNIKKGDLIFFPGHVAIYMGHSKFIHSSVANDGVYINSFNKYDKDCYRKDLADSISATGSIF